MVHECQNCAAFTNRSATSGLCHLQPRPIEVSSFHWCMSFTEHPIFYAKETAIIREAINQAHGYDIEPTAGTTDDGPAGIKEP